MRARRRAMAVLTVTALLLAGCGGDDDGKESADRPARTTTTTAPSTTTEPKAPTAEARPVAVTLTDDSVGLPAEVTAGPTRFVATNRGKRPHGVVLVELTEGQTPAALAAALAEDSAEALAASRLVPGPQNVAPGTSGAMLVDLEAGTYAAVATVSGRHAFPPAKAMIRPVTVRRAATPVEGTALPSGPTITVDDDAIEVPDGFDGKGLFRVENVGDEPHELVLYRVAFDTTYAQAVEYLTAETTPKGAVLATPAGGLGALSPGAEAALDLDLADAIYVVMCLLPGADGKPHDLVAPPVIPGIA